MLLTQLTQQLAQFRESFSFLHLGPRIQDASKVPMCGGFASPMVYCVQKFCIHRHQQVFCCVEVVQSRTGVRMTNLTNSLVQYMQQSERVTDRTLSSFHRRSL
mgnify:CR=1 FL=1